MALNWTAVPTAAAALRGQAPWPVNGLAAMADPRDVYLPGPGALEAAVVEPTAQPAMAGGIVAPREWALRAVGDSTTVVDAREVGSMAPVAALPLPAAGAAGTTAPRGRAPRPVAEAMAPREFHPPPLPPGSVCAEPTDPRDPTGMHVFYGHAPYKAPTANDLPSPVNAPSNATTAAPSLMSSVPFAGAADGAPPLPPGPAPWETSGLFVASIGPGVGASVQPSTASLDEPPLPPFWVAKKSTTRGHNYYFNTRTCESRWTRPTV